MTSSDLGLLGPATAQWNDFVGSAAADDLELNDNKSLYQLTGINPARWLIVGVDFSVRRGVQQVMVYAYDRETSGAAPHACPAEIIDARGEVPVVGFQLEEPDEPRAWLGQLFRHVALRLVARGLKDSPVVVTAVTTPQELSLAAATAGAARRPSPSTDPSSTNHHLSEGNHE